MERIALVFVIFLTVTVLADNLPCKTCPKYCKCYKKLQTEPTKTVQTAKKLADAIQFCRQQKGIKNEDADDVTRQTRCRLGDCDCVDFIAQVNGVAAKSNDKEQACLAKQLKVTTEDLYESFNYYTIGKDHENCAMESCGFPDEKFEKNQDNCTKIEKHKYELKKKEEEGNKKGAEDPDDAGGDALEDDMDNAAEEAELETSTGK